MAAYTQIIEDTCNRFWMVRDTNDADLAHVWLGVEAKRVKGGFSPKAGRAGTRETLVRREATRLVATL